MIPVHDDLLTVLDAVRIESHSSYRILVTDGANVEGSDLYRTIEGPNRLVEALADDVYSTLYCRPLQAGRQPPFDEIARRDHMSSLAAANCGRGTWQAGWTVRRIEAEGAVAVTKGEVFFWASPREVRPSDAELVPGAKCRVWVPPELRSLVPGFYMAIGDGYRDDEKGELAEEPQVRFYWHLTAQAAAPFIAATTSLLNASQIPFEVKVLSDPNAYTRADAAVLYLRPSHDSRIGEILSEIHSAVAAWLRGCVPLFTRRIADGLGYAEFPSSPISFGQHRCRLVADAVWESFEQGDTDRDDRVRRLASAFLKGGLDPARPYLERGSRHDLPFNLPGDDAVFKATRSINQGRRSPGMVNADDRLPSSTLDAARRIGNTLCQTAHWDSDGRFCNWLGRSMAAETVEPGMPIKPMAIALGPDLYSGSTGVALYLAELFAVTRDAEHRRTALGAMARSIRQLDRAAIAEPNLSLSLFFGDLGATYVARKLALLTGESALVAQADHLFERIVAGVSRPHCLDVMSGNAGAIPVLLQMSRETGLARYQDLASLLGSEICELAIRAGNACCWDPVRASGPGIATRPLAGLSHGAAGIGLALLELYVATGRLDFRDTARGAFAFENSLFDQKNGNWRDLRGALTANHFSCAWCHGAPGIALSRLRAASLDPDRAESYLEEARIALATTLDAIDKNLAAASSDASLCHGLAGLGEIALVAGQTLKNASFRGRALTLAEVLIERHGSSGNWPSGVPSRGPNPSLMLGLAGIGYWFLRLHDPNGVPSILLRSP